MVLSGRSENFSVEPVWGAKRLLRLQRLIAGVVVLVVLWGGVAYCDSGSKEFEPAEIVVQSRAQWEYLFNSGVSLERRDERRVWVWINKSQHKQLVQQGFQPVWQIEPAKRYWKDRSDRLAKNQLLDEEYPTYEDVVNTLESLVAQYPDLCSLHSIGQSIQKRELYMIRIRNSSTENQTLPGIKLIGSIHGNELLPVPLLLRFASFLLEEYDTSSDVRFLVDHSDLWIMPLMNPDGYVYGNRFNADGVDLNRSFPDLESDPVNNTVGRQPETAALMNFQQARRTVLSANFHTGAVVVNYPWDNQSQPTIDDSLFHRISRVYADLNPRFLASSAGPFDRGVVRGWLWYAVYGGMQDWNYGYASCHEVTIELSDQFVPPASEIEDYWQENRPSLMSYVLQAQQCVAGRVVDYHTGEPLDATIEVLQHPGFVVRSNLQREGLFFRMLAPGEYNLIIRAEGFVDQNIPVVVTEQGLTNLGEIQMETQTPVRDSLMLLY